MLALKGDQAENDTQSSDTEGSHWRRFWGRRALR